MRRITTEMTKRFNMMLTLVLVAFSGFTVFAQEVAEVSKDSTNKKQIDIVVGIGAGAVRYMGDVQDASKKTNVHLIGNRVAYDFNVGIGLSKSFTANLNLIYGKLSGNENTFGQHRNFETQMVNVGASVEYNFAGLYKKRLPVLNPFIVGGVYYGNYFDIATDLVNKDGVAYNYWSDGRIRDLAEADLFADDAVNMSRDYTYEKPLLNRAVHTGSVAGGIGIDLHLSRAFTVRLMSRYFHSFSDEIDGFNDGSFAQNRDGFFFTNASLVVYPMAFKANRKELPSSFRYLIDFKEIELQDVDEDGVYDMSDRCAGTPKGVKVDKEGCPLDEDGDGIPDYRDKDKGTVLGAIVDANGTPIDYELVAFYANDTLGVSRIKWNKKYLNPRYNVNDGYTVNVKTVKSDGGKQLNPILGSIKELRRQVINDSLIVYRLGTYQHFADADSKSKEIAEAGESQAYGVPESMSLQVAEELYGLEVPDSILKTFTYGIRKSIPIVKASEAYKNAALSYSVASVEKYLNEDVPESLLVKDYVNTLGSFTWDSAIESVHSDISQLLIEKPVTSKPEYFAPKAQDEIVEGKLSENSSNTAMTEEKIGSDTLLRNQQSINLQAEEVAKQTAKKPSETAVKKSDPVVINPKNMVTTAPVKPAFKAADQDGDGFITSTEIEKILEEILEGHSPITVSQFNEMVQYYAYFTNNADPIDFGGTQVVIVDGVLSILKKEGAGLKEESRRILAKKYSEADMNKDGDLTSDEVQKMINRFMEGDKTYSSDKIYELIDLYFD